MQWVMRTRLLPGREEEESEKRHLWKLSATRDSAIKEHVEHVEHEFQNAHQGHCPVKCDSQAQVLGETFWRLTLTAY